MNKNKWIGVIVGILFVLAGIGPLSDSGGGTAGEINIITGVICIVLGVGIFIFFWNRKPK